MKVLLFVLFAGYAVRCDENNYYVVEMRADPKPFKVYWNVPTMQCQSKKIPFNNLFDKFGIIQNTNDRFRGDKVTILYDPGLFPALLKNETSGRFKFRNGGVPQQGDLEKHLTAFKDELDQSIPDTGFDGIGIIDFESWRPVYRQNFGVLQPYKDVSYEIERKRNSWWNKKWLEAEAKRRFEDAARSFMQSTLSVARQLRPNAQWGFYGFPYCFNMASNNMKETCASNVPQENNNISWLWQESTALYPSVYSSASLSTSQMTSLIQGRVREAARLSRSSRILPYFWYRYRDASFLSQTDLNAALDTLYKSSASGFIIWGSSSDVNTVDKCNKLLNYIEQVMGPAIAKYTKSRSLPDNIDTTSNDTSTDIEVKLVKNTLSNVATTTSPTDSTNKIDLDPEYHWVPPENYTQAIKDHVNEEISKKLINISETDKNAVLNSSVLIDLILNYIINSNISDSTETTVSNVDGTSKLGVNSELEPEESQSSTTTEAAKAETARDAITEEIQKDQFDVILSTESLTSFETTTTYVSNKDTSQMYDTFDTTDKIDIVRDKNIKKSSIQDDMEDFYDITTETLSTETTEQDSFKTENTTVFNDLTTEYIFDKDYTTQITESIETTAKDERSTKIDEIETSATETTNSIQKLSQSTSANPSTIELYLNNANASTKAPIFNENNETFEDTIDNITKTNHLSTKSPGFIETTTTEDKEIEDTSLLSTTTSPEQVTGSAPRITKSQSLYCIIFYIYSISKCLCSIFGQCS